MSTYYEPDLAWVHHTGYSHHVDNVWRGVVRLLRAGGVADGARVLDVGCGSGLLARRLIAEGFDVTGIDASPAMVDLARGHAPGARFEVVKLPAVSRTLQASDAIVSTGHVLNYLDSREDIAQALRQLAQALRHGGVIAIDLMTEHFARRDDAQHVHAKVTDDWAIVTRFSRPQPDRFDRDITVFRRVADHWHRSDEHHRNLTFDASDALRILRESGVDALGRASFGDETLPEGLVVLTGVRRGG
jgi:SAM-dependent methyltransferase